MISLEEFKKIELRVAKIKEVSDHPDADKLLVLKIEVGEELKQIVAGIKLHYSKEELVDKQIVIVNNLEPVIIRGQESQGMLLAASDENTLTLITPEKRISCGAFVK
ncbi:MAG: hypothetical protein ABIG64_00985 [Candidatus Omnitrophota bacterium]